MTMQFYTKQALVYCGLAFVLFTTPAQADLDTTQANGQPSGSLEVHVQAFFDNPTAVGILMSDSGTIQKPQVTLRHATIPDHYIVSIPFEHSELQQGSMATAMLISQDGEVAIGNVKPASIPSARSSFLSMDYCHTEHYIPDSARRAYVNPGILEPLMQIRKSRREVARMNAANILKGSLLDRLRQAEEVLGFKYREPLSANLPAFELADRLARLRTALTAMVQEEIAQEKR